VPQEVKALKDLEDQVALRELKVPEVHKVHKVHKVLEGIQVYRGQLETKEAKVREDRRVLKVLRELREPQVLKVQEAHRVLKVPKQPMDHKVLKVQEDHKELKVVLVLRVHRDQEVLKEFWVLQQHFLHKVLKGPKDSKVPQELRELKVPQGATLVIQYPWMVVSVVPLRHVLVAAVQLRRIRIVQCRRGDVLFMVGVIVLIVFVHLKVLPLGYSFAMMGLLTNYLAIVLRTAKQVADVQTLD
jgi:hypothetical protein